MIVQLESRTHADTIKVLRGGCVVLLLLLLLLLLTLLFQIKEQVERWQSELADAQAAYHEQSVIHVTRHTSHVTSHTSHVTRHTSHVTRHTSHVTGSRRRGYFSVWEQGRRYRLHQATMIT